MHVLGIIRRWGLGATQDSYSQQIQVNGEL